MSLVMKRFYLRKGPGKPLLGPMSAHEILGRLQGRQISEYWQAIEDDGSGPASLEALPPEQWRSVTDLAKASGQFAAVAPGKWFRLEIDGRLRGPLTLGDACRAPDGRSLIDWAIIAESSPDGTLPVWRPACLVATTGDGKAPSLPPPASLRELLARCFGAIVAVTAEDGLSLRAGRCAVVASDMVVIQEVGGSDALVVPFQQIEAVQIRAQCIPLPPAALSNVRQLRDQESPITVEVPLALHVRPSSLSRPGGRPLVVQLPGGADQVPAASVLGVALSLPPSGPPLPAVSV